jgi:tetratricopeptide (TPR) repeat protein
MDCALVERGDLAERYLLGRLSEEERTAFEEHYFECDRCFDDLERLRAIQAELADSTTDDTAEVRQPRIRRKWFVGIGAAATLAALGIALQVFTPSPQLAPEILDLARIDPPVYEPVRLRGAADEARQHFGNAMRFYSGGDYASAIPGLEKAADLDPSSPEYSFYLGACYLLTDLVSEGIASLGDTVDLGETPFLEESLLLIAKARLSTDDLSGSIEAFEEVTKLHGDFMAEARNALEILGGLSEIDPRSKR